MSQNSQTTQNTRKSGYLDTWVSKAPIIKLIQRLLYSFRKTLEHPESVPEETVKWSESALETIEAWLDQINELVTISSELPNSSAYRVFGIADRVDKEGNPVVDESGNILPTARALTAPCKDKDAAQLEYAKISLGQAYPTVVLPQLVLRLEKIAQWIGGDSERDEEASNAKCEADLAIAHSLEKIVRECRAMITTAIYHAEQISNHRREYREANPDAPRRERKPRESTDSKPARREREPREGKPARREREPSDPKPARRERAPRENASSESTATRAPVWNRKSNPTKILQAVAQPESQAVVPTTKAVVPATVPATVPQASVPSLNLRQASIYVGNHQVQETLLDVSSVKILSIPLVHMSDTGVFSHELVYVIPGSTPVPESIAKVYTPTGIVTMIFDPSKHPSVTAHPMVVMKDGKIAGQETVYVLPGISPTITRL